MGHLAALDGDIGRGFADRRRATFAAGRALEPVGPTAAGIGASEGSGVPLQVGLALHVEKSSARASKAARPSGDSSIPFSPMHLAKISFVEWTKETALPLR